MLSERSKVISPSVTIAISTAVKALNKKGVEVTNLSIGEPDFFTPQRAKEAGIQAIIENKTKYDSASGLLELKDAIIDKLKSDNKLSYTRDEIVISCGAKHAITNALLALVNPGEEVIIPKPYWTSYPEMVKLLNANPVFVDTKEENSFKLQAKELKSVITNKSKVLMITNPSNPTGAVYSKEELESIVQLCMDHDIYILADEIYEKIIFTESFTSIASLSEGAKALTITINGLSKSASMTGWRLGYTGSSKELATAMSSIQGHLVSHPSTITQWAALEALRNCQTDTDNMVKVYLKRRNKVIEMFKEIEEVSIIQPDGAFYIFINISKLRPFFKDSASLSIDVCQKLLEDYQLALVPGTAFGLDDYVRMTYAAHMDIVTAGINKIKKFIRDL